MDDNYLYEGETYCPMCLPVASNHPDVHDGGGEQDTPAHCSVCRRPVKYDLTPEGVQYVIDAMVDTLYEGPAEWNKVYSLPNVVQPEHRTADVVALAAGVAENPVSAPILADALMDAGFGGTEDETRFLEFLQGPAVKDGGRIKDAVMGANNFDGDWYLYGRAVDVERDWAEEIRNYGYPGDGGNFPDAFLKLTAEGADPVAVLREIIESGEHDGQGYVDWDDLLDAWLEVADTVQGGT